MAFRFPRRPLRVALSAMSALLVLAAGGAAVLVARFDPDDYRALIEREARHATGRALHLGHLSLAWLPGPTLVADDVSLDNVAGGSQPAMLTVRRLTARLAWAPLLRRTAEITSLTLENPTILLETDAQGRPNWRFEPEPTLPATSDGPAVRARGSRTRVVLRRLRLLDGTLAWRDGRAERTRVLALPRLDATLSPVRNDVAATAEWQGDAVSGTLSLATGPVADMSGVPWPLLFTGSADLGGLVSGLSLDATELRLTGPNQPVAVAVRGHLGAAPLGLTGTVATPGLLAAGAAWPVDLSGRLGQATLTARGDIAAPATLAGVSLAVSARVPDLAALGAAANHALPAVTDLSLDATLRDQDGLAQGASLRDIRLKAPQGDLTGEVSYAWNSARLRASVASGRLDCDDLRAVWPASAPASAASPAPSARPDGTDLVVPDTPLPFGALRTLDADLRAQVGELRWRNRIWRGLAGHLVLAAGQLRLDPFAVRTPAGVAAAQLTVSTSDKADAVSLAVQAPSLDLAELSAAFGTPDLASGRVNLRARLDGTGRTPHALLSTLSGQVGFVSQEGLLDNAVTGQLLDRLLHGAAGALPFGSGQSRMRCILARLDSRDGQARLTTLLDSARLRVTGTGTLDLGAETMDMRLRPSLWLGLGGIEAPLRLRGPWRAPRLTVGGTTAPGGEQPETALGGTDEPAAECALPEDAAAGGAAAP